ncbi:MAG: hypothetical protein ABS28_04120 [Cryomorphaceae bacterium BACL22 MAG-120619-bin32]|jgi:hypothetical protein|nr:MAG: hypothetical protein ABS28_04120 [Cryomorphaceae bacterium BACL22 MAG-120619-bin32]
MKKLYILFLLTALPFMGFGQTFDFTNAVDGWDAATTGATLTANSTFVAVNLTEAVNNPKIGSATAGVDGVTNKICAVTLQNLSASGPTFMRISFAKTGGRIYIQQDITAGDTGYVTYYFDLTNADWGNDVPENDIQVHFKAAGNANYAAPVGGVTLNIDKIEFLTSIPTIERQTYNFDTDNDSESWSATNGTIVSVASGVLTFAPTVDKYAKLSMFGGLYHVNLSIVNAMNVTLTNLSTDDDELRLVVDGNIIETKLISVSDGSEKSYRFDVSSLTGNTSDISLAFRNADQPVTPGWSSGTGNFVINSIIFDNTLSVNDIDYRDDASILIYPNPVQNTLKVNASKDITKIEVYNILGQNVLSNKNSNTLNVQGLIKGTYIAKIHQDNDTISTKRFIKE